MWSRWILCAAYVKRQYKLLIFGAIAWFLLWLSSAVSTELKLEKITAEPFHTVPRPASEPGGHESTDLIERARWCVDHCSIDNRRQLARQLAAIVAQRHQRQAGANNTQPMPSGLRIKAAVLEHAGPVPDPCSSVVIAHTNSPEMFSEYVAVPGCQQTLARISVPSDELPQSLSVLNRPYVLLVATSAPPIVSARKLAAFLRRLQFAGVVGGSTVLPIGDGTKKQAISKRTVSCLTLSMKSYVLKVQSRVFRNGGGCLYCDAVKGPVMLRRTLLDRFPFPDAGNFGVFGAMLSWFMTLQGANIVTVSCPDAQVGFSQVSKGADDLIHLTTFGAKWNINRIHLPGAKVVQVPCTESLEHKTSLQKLVKHSAVPLCVLKRVGSALELLLRYTRDNDLRMHLMSGSALAAVKMSALLPWDLDMDIRIPHRQWHRFRNISEHLPGVFRLSNIQSPLIRGKKMISTINLHVGAMNIELWGSDDSMFPDVPFPLPDTLAALDFPNGTSTRRLWFPVPLSPGLYVRNYYGPGYLQHAPHWRHLGKKNNHEAYDNVTVRRAWLLCPPEALACLEQFPVDGNVGVRLEQAHDENW